MRTRWRIAAGLAIGLALAMPVGAQRQTAAPGPLAPFGVAEITARRALLSAVSGGADVIAAFMATIIRGYERIPAPSRSGATTAAFAWARTFLESPAFAAEYEKARAEHKPDGAQTSLSIDEAVKKQIADEIAQLEESRKAGESLPPQARAGFMATTDQLIAERRKPEYATTLRKMTEINRADSSAAASKAAEEWSARFPPTPAEYVRTHLQKFLADTAGVDFESPATLVKGADGIVVGFLRPGMTTITIPHMHAVVAGRLATDAARASAEGWLKESK